MNEFKLMWGLEGEPGKLDPSHVLAYLKSVKAIAAADGLSPPERDVLMSAMRELGVEEAIITEVEAHQSDGVDLLTLLPTGLDKREARMLLYDAVRLASADGFYSADEQRAVRSAARALGIGVSWVEAMEALVDVEWKVETEDLDAPTAMWEMTAFKILPEQKLGVARAPVAFRALGGGLLSLPGLIEGPDDYEMVHIVDTLSVEPRQGKLIHLRQEGMFVGVTNPPPLMSRVSVTFDLPQSGPVEATGIIMWRSVGPGPQGVPGFGILFETLPIEVRKLIAAAT